MDARPSVDGMNPVSIRIVVTPLIAALAQAPHTGETVPWAAVVDTFPSHLPVPRAILRRLMTSCVPRAASVSPTICASGCSRACCVPQRASGGATQWFRRETRVPLTSRSGAGALASAAIMRARTSSGTAGVSSLALIVRRRYVEVGCLTCSVYRSVV